MSDRTSWLQEVPSGRWLAIGAIALLLITSTKPGDVITLKADCTTGWAVGDIDPISQAQCLLVVRALPIYDRPVYLALGWERKTKLKTGEILIYHDTAAEGQLVRAFVDTDVGVRLIDGILTNEGKVAAGGYLYDISPRPTESGQG